MPHDDTATLVIPAGADSIHSALMDPTGRAAWLRPVDMHGRTDRFDASVGGGYRMTLTYDSDTGAGKTTSGSDA